jgi:hypothetical protein
MEIGVVPSERSSVLQIYYVAPGATLSQCLVWDRMNALIALLPLDRTGGCVTMLHTTRRILSLLSPHPSSVHIFGTLPPSVSVIRNCLAQRVNVHLLEWLSASPHTGNNGLEEFCQPLRPTILISDGLGGDALISAAPCHAHFYCWERRV